MQTQVPSKCKSYIALRWTIGHGIAIVSAALLLGCDGGPTYSNVTLSGRVTLDGAPIESGKITFIPQSRGVGRGGWAKIEQGDYTLDEVPLGSVAFIFSAAVETGKQVPGPGGAPEPERINIIPERYGQEGIQRDISDGGTQDFALESHR